MNRSQYIQTLKDQYQLDVNELWKKSILDGKKEGSRILCDDKEKDFWRGHSEKYDHIPSLYDYAPSILDKLVDITGVDKHAIEIGCGTGKFTIPMAKKCRKIIGLDFSDHMLAKIQTKLTNSSIDNIELKSGKFEDTDLDSTDVIYAINANYRMIDLEANLKKMRELAREKVVIVWTMQRNLYDDLLNQTHIKGIGRGREYIYMINILYNMGIDPNLEIIPVLKPVIIEDLCTHYSKIEKLCRENGLDEEFVKASFDRCLSQEAGHLIYNRLIKVVFIHFSGSASHS